MSGNILRRHTKFLDLAARLAKRHSACRIKMACVIARRGTLVSWGVNKSITHPRAAKMGYRFNSIHAEMAAVLGVDLEDLRGTTAYVSRPKVLQKRASSMPCPLCLQVLAECGIRSVWYSSRDGSIEMTAL